MFFDFHHVGALLNTSSSQVNVGGIIRLDGSFPGAALLPYK